MTRKYFFHLTAILVLLSILFPLSSAISQQELLVLENSVKIEYGENIQFAAEFDPTLKIEEISLIFNANSDNISKNIPITLNENNKISFTYLPEVFGDIPSFSFIDYSYSALLNDGTTLQSSIFNFLYIDNKFEWKNITDQKSFLLFWHAGDIAFANEILDTAKYSISYLDQFITLLPIEEPITIITYQYASDLQASLSFSGQTWLAGHADSNSRFAKVSLQPGQNQQIEIERQVPHEIAHIRIHQITQSTNANLPIWFNEGIASLAELSPNSDYPVILKTAFDNNQIIPITDLCETFPSNPTNIALAYAQSDSFLRYIHQKFGKEGLDTLLQAFIDGDTCLTGTISAFGFTLPQLDSFWRQTAFQESQDEILIDNFIPFLSILIVVSAGLVVIILATIFKQREKVKGSGYEQ